MYVSSKVLHAEPRGFRLVRHVIRNLDSMKDVVIMAGSADTVDNAKAKIQNKFDIPAFAQKLVLRSTELLEGSIAEHVQFEQEEFILHVRDMRTMQVVIATLSGRSCL